MLLNSGFCPSTSYRRRNSCLCSFEYGVNGPETDSPRSTFAMSCSEFFTCASSGALTTSSGLSNALNARMCVAERRMAEPWLP